MEKIIKEWTASKNTNDFNYVNAFKTLIKNRSIENQSIADYIHFDLSNQDIKDKFEAIDNLNFNYLANILELINHYHYYLNMNNLIKKDEDNIKKLKKLNKLMDSDFLEFLDNYLDLDKTIISSNKSLKIEDDYQDVIKYYLEYDFKFALNTLENFLNHSQKKNSLSISDKDLTNTLIIKPKTKSYLNKISQRAILKCLYFDLIYYYKGITKKQSIEIIKDFFDVTLEESKIQHTLSVKAIDFITNNKDKLYEIVNSYDVCEFDRKGNIINKNIPNHIKEIKEIFKLKTFINDNFTPHITIHNK